jgi:hypothetical protein
MQLQHLCNRRGIGLSLIYAEGCSLVPKARNRLVATFQEIAGDAILFLDDDIVFQATDAMKLVDHLEAGSDVVAGVYVTKTEPPFFMSTPKRDHNGALIFKSGLVEMERIPAGFMMVSRDVMNACCEASPTYEDVGKPHWAVFQTPTDDEGIIGEDYFFCDLVRSLGWRIYVEPDMTLEHVGTTHYKASFKLTVQAELDGVNTTLTREQAQASLAEAV